MEPLKGLSTRAVVLVLGLALIIVAFVLGLMWLAGPDGQTDARAWITSITSLIAGSFGISATVMGVRNSRINKTIAGNVEQVQQQTNGALDARIQAAIVSALAQQHANITKGK